MVLVVVTSDCVMLNMKSLLRRVFYILIPFSVVLVKYFPGIGRVYHRQTGELMALGVTTHKNSLGALCVISIIFFVYSLNDKINEKNNKIEKYYNMIILFQSIWLLNLANSQTSNL